MTDDSKPYRHVTVPGAAAIAGPGGGVRAGPQQHGFTLIEAVIAMGVFSFVLAGLALLMISTIKTNSNAKRFTAASALAQTKLEDLRAAANLLLELRR